MDTDDLKGLCLTLGIIGLGYVALLMIVALLTGAKVIKSIMFISVFSTFLVSLGLTPQVKSRLASYLKTRTSELFA